MTYAEMVLAVLDGEPYELEGRHPARGTRYTCNTSGHLVHRAREWESWWPLSADRPHDEVDGWEVVIRCPETFWDRAEESEMNETGAWRPPALWLPEKREDDDSALVRNLAEALRRHRLASRAVRGGSGGEGVNLKDVQEIAETCLKSALEQHGASIKEESEWKGTMDDDGTIKRYVLHQTPEVAREVQTSSDRAFIDATQAETMRHLRGCALVSVIGTYAPVGIEGPALDAGEEYLREGEREREDARRWDR